MPANASMTVCGCPAEALPSPPRPRRAPLFGALVLWASSSGPLQAQAGRVQVTGTVTAAATSSPLVCATVTLTSERIEVITDVTGSFALELEPGEYLARVTYDGYASVDRLISVPPAGALEFRLDEGPALETVAASHPRPRAAERCLFGRVIGLRLLLQEGKSSRNLLQKGQGPVPGAQIQLAGNGPWVDLWRDSSLYAFDNIRLEKRYHLRVKVERSSQAGELVFFPDLPDSDESRFFGDSIRTGEFALYSLGDDPEIPGNISVAIERGQLGVSWQHGRLAVHLAGQRSYVDGTSVLFSASRDSALVFLNRGDMRFPDAPSIKAENGDSFRLRRGEQPKRVTAIAPVALFASHLLFTVTELWQASIFTQPSLYIAATAVLAPTVYVIVDRSSRVPVDVTFVTLRLPNF